MKIQYNLPNGKIAKSRKQFISAWDVIRKDLESRGLVLHSCDPGISFLNKMKTKDGVEILPHAYSLSVEIYSKLVGIDFINREY